MSHPDDTRILAEELYVYDGMTPEQITEKLDIPIQTLKQWASDRGWYQLKKELQTANIEIRHNSIRLLQKATKEALDSLDPEKIDVLSRLRPAIGWQDKGNAKEPDIDRPRMFLKDMEFAVKVLQEVDPAALKLFGKNFGIIVRRWKEKHNQTGQPLQSGTNRRGGG